MLWAPETCLNAGLAVQLSYVQTVDTSDWFIQEKIPMKYCINTEHTANIWLINLLTFSNIFTNWASIGDWYEYLDEFLKNLQNSQAEPKSQRTPHLIFATGKKILWYKWSVERNRKYTLIKWLRGRIDNTVCLFVHLVKKITSDMKLLRFGINISVLVTFKNLHQQCHILYNIYISNYY